MQKEQFVALVHLCRANKDKGLWQRRWARNRSGKKFRHSKNRAGIMVMDEEKGRMVEKKVVTPLQHRHYIHFDERLYLILPRSKDERVKSIDTFIEIVAENGLLDVAEKMRTMRGFKRGSDVHWYCESNVEEGIPYMEYMQQLADEMNNEPLPIAMLEIDDFAAVKFWDN